MYKKIFLAGFIAAVLFCSCKKETEELGADPLTEYMPLEKGKYIIYQLDSFRYVPQTLRPLTISYQVKYVVGDTTQDNSGRTAYKINRFIRESAADDWTPDNTFMAVNTGTSIELVENNLRFIKLKAPVAQDFTWKGNAYINPINDDSLHYFFSYLDGWDYVYDSVNAPLTLGSITVENTVKVAQRDEVVGNPDDRNAYSEVNYGVEYYAKGIGMVYKRILHSEYQPPVNSYGGYYSDNTAGATFTMIEHN